MDETGRLEAISALSRFSIRLEEAAVAASLLEEALSSGESDEGAPGGSSDEATGTDRLLKEAGDAVQALLERVSEQDHAK